MDPAGRIRNCVHNSKGRRTFIEGSMVDNVALVDDRTFYSRFGDVFTFGCMLLLAGAAVKGLLKRKRNILKI